MNLKGVCNRCGNCCMVGDAKCTNLIVTGKPGEPQATMCAVYLDRVPGMTTILMRPDGTWFEGVCQHTMPVEVEILAGLIKEKKCVLELED